jgi:flagellar protein FlgJ
MLSVNPFDTKAVTQISTADRGTPREKQALQEYEHLFLYQFLQEMRKGVPDDPLFGKSSERSFFEDTMDDFLAGKIASSGQFGIAKTMQQQLSLSTLPSDAQKAAYSQGISLHPGPSSGIALKSAAGLALPKREHEGIPFSSTKSRYNPLLPIKTQESIRSRI